ncbi:MAG TPA: ROK family protein [Herpetosiphonaceae bacterium]
MKYVIGVDLGGTQVRAVRIDRDGQIFAYERAETAAESGPAGVLAQIESLITTVTGDTSRSEIIGVGVGTPGPIDPFAGVVLEAPNLPGWINVPIKAILSERTGLPVEVGNDANVAALGEWRFGCGRGCQHFIYVTISTGIGGGVIADSKLLLGRKGIAGEVGHMTIQTDGPLCGCGNYGCWESMASGTALARVAVGALREEQVAGRRSLIAEIAGAEPVEGRHIAAAAAQGDRLAQTLMEREGELIGVGLVNLFHLFAPERIALGGGVTKSMDLLEPHMLRMINERAMPPYRDTPVQLAQLADKVGVLGAAALML